MLHDSANYVDQLWQDIRRPGADVGDVLEATLELTRVLTARADRLTRIYSKRAQHDVLLERVLHVLCQSNEFSSPSGRLRQQLRGRMVDAGLCEAMRSDVPMVSESDAFLLKEHEK